MADSEATPVPSTRETCGAGKVVGTSTVLLLAAVFFFFMAICFVLFLYVYAKWRFGPGASARDVTAEHEHRDDPTTQGLSPDVIKSLPTVVLESRDGMECAVCLSEMVGGEKARLLPKCGHGFHVECIDVWLLSHSTCPLCRNPVPAGQVETPEVVSMDDVSSASLPTNVLFWGTASGSVQEAHSSPVPNPPPTSSSSEGTLVIDIPGRATDGFPSLEQENGNAKSATSSTMTTPNSTRLRSLRRFLSRGKRVVGLVGCSSSSPAEAADVEKGGVGMSSAGTPKTTPADL